MSQDILFNAVLNNDETLIQQIAEQIDRSHLEYHVYNESWKGFMNPFEKAAELGRIKHLKILANAGIYEKIKNWEVNKYEIFISPIFVSAFFGRIEVFDFLLNLTSQELHKTLCSSSIHFAVLGEQQKMLDYLLGCEVDIDLRNNPYDVTKPIMSAVYQDDLIAIEKLICAGADIEPILAEPYNGIGPLYQAAKQGSKSIFDYLFPQVIDKHEKELAQSILPKEIYKREQSNDIKLKNIDTAIQNNDLESLKILLPKVDINCYSRIILERSIDYGRLDIVNLLIQMGVDINMEFEDGSTPLKRALTSVSKEIVRLLISAGVDLARDNFMYWAVHEDSLESVLMLIEANADPNIISYGLSPLMIAVSRRNFQITKRLLEVGVFLDLKDNLGRSALTIAKEINCNDIAQLLISAGASE
jgi:ankyrin repeat protein